MTLAARVLDGLGPAIRRRAGALLPDLVDALTVELEPADQLVQPAGRFGAAAAFDARTTSQPAWLGFATGTRIPPGLSLTDQCTYLAEQPAWRRGTVPAMKAAVRAALGVNFDIEIVERVDGDPYRFGIRIHTSHLSDEQIAAAVAAALTEKPLGLLADVDVDVVSTGPSNTHFVVAHGSYSELGDDIPTYDDMSTHVPEEGTPA